MAKQEVNGRYLYVGDFNPLYKQGEIEAMDAIIRSYGVSKYEILSKEITPVKGSKQLKTLNVKYKVLKMDT